jgi:hypothetical protein
MAMQTMSAGVGMVTAMKTIGAGVGGIVMAVQTMSAGGSFTISSRPGFEFSCGRVAHVHDPASSIVNARFQEFAKRWRNATSHLSLASRMANHPAYRQIVAMGAAVVPFLLAELRRKPDHWFIALEEITGENPVPPESEGKVKKMADAWVQWGIQRGHIK